MADSMNAAQPQSEVRQVMTRQVEAAHLHESLDTALDRMIVRGVSALPVVDGDELVGLITAADIRRHAATTDETKVSDVAILGAFHCYEHDAAADAAMTMQKLNVPWLAVLNADHGLVGMVAEGDVRPASSKESHARPIEQTQGADEPTEENPGLRVYSDRPRLKR